MIKAYAVQERGAKLTAFEYDPGELGNNEVEIAVEHCGICQSDISMIDNDWGFSQYPLVPGHEVIGTIVAAGSQVTHLSIGQRVGLGWQAGACMGCGSCMSGDHNLCPSRQQTILGGHHGGFADRVRAQSEFAIPLPSTLDPASAGPLLCGGITVFNPLLQLNVKPTDRVGVIGIGGLGHLALGFLNAWGCEVTAFSSSSDKKDEAMRLGATHFVDSTDSDALSAISGTLDFILSTVNVALDWNSYLGALTSKGRLHMVGVTAEPVSVSSPLLMAKQNSLSASPVGSPANIATMLEFAARHDIKPLVEKYRFSQINEAIERMRSGKARYRIVLSQDN
jgi:uncharacterized zinc-type alcohol dehydrogenase-like protein